MTSSTVPSHRVNLSVPQDLYQTFVALAGEDHVSVSTKVLQLAHQRLRMMEDEYIHEIASNRTAKTPPESWKSEEDYQKTFGHLLAA